MTEKTKREKMLAGELYGAVDRELAAMLDRALDLLRDFNSATSADRRAAVLRSLLGQQASAAIGRGFTDLQTGSIAPSLKNSVVVST